MSAEQRGALERERMDLLHRLDPWPTLSGPRVAWADRLILVEHLLMETTRGR